jgi:rubrerythrin
MNSERLFTLAGRLELAAAECYKRIDGLAVPDSDVAQDLKQLAREEVVHAQLLKTGKDFAASDPGLFDANILTEDDLNRYLAMAEQLIGDVERKAVMLPEALKRMLDLEVLMEQAHAATIVLYNDPAVKKLFMALSQGDKRHREMLEKLIRTLPHDQAS